MNSSSPNLVPTARFNNFNFFRLLFATLVILSHSFEMVDGNRSRELLTMAFKTISFGEFAVDGFFLLSGYLIVKSWESEPRAIPFLVKRLLRIHPGYVVAVLISIFIVGPLGTDAVEYFNQLRLRKVFSEIILMNGPNAPSTFKGEPYPIVNGSLWTIRLEFICYLFVLFFGLLGFIKQRTAWLAVTGMLFAALILRASGFQLSAAGTSNLLHSPLLRLSMFFFAGGVFYLYRDHLLFTRVRLILAFSALFICMFSGRFSEIALASFGAYLLFFLVFKPIRALSAFQKMPDISYGLYLYGWPTQALLIWYFPNLSPWLVFIFALTGAGFLGYVSWQLVERQALKFKTRVRLTPWVAATAASEITKKTQSAT